MRLKLLTALAFILVASTVRAVPVAPNASLIKGIAMECEAISSTLLGMQPEQTIYRLTIQIESTEDVSEMVNLLDKGTEGKEMVFYTKETLPPDILKKRIKARVMYQGDERGGRWWIQEIRILV